MGKSYWRARRDFIRRNKKYWFGALTASLVAIVVGVVPLVMLPAAAVPAHVLALVGAGTCLVVLGIVTLVRGGRAAPPPSGRGGDTAGVRAPRTALRRLGSPRTATSSPSFKATVTGSPWALPRNTSTLPTCTLNDIRSCSAADRALYCPSASTHGSAARTASAAVR
jgi:hypothetical protein